MWNIVKKYPKAFAAAIIGHVLVALLFSVSFQWAKLPEPPTEVDVVQATAIDESQVQAEIKKLRDQEQHRKDQETDRVRKLEEQAEQARKQREQEQQQIAELETQKKQEVERKKQLESERKQAEEATKKASDAKRIAEQKAKQADDERKRIENQRLAAELEKKRLEDIAKQAREEARKALEAQRQAEDQKLRDQQMREENERLKSARDKQVNDTVRSYIAQIRQKVERNWIEPGTMRDGMSCTVAVKMMPSGEVLDVRITKSSGDRIFDDSVETAVRRAAPLPLPPDTSLFSHFRDLEFVFKPDKKR